MLTKTLLTEQPLPTIPLFTSESAQNPYYIEWIGKKIRKYTIGELAYRGTVAELYRAESKGKSFLLKVLQPKYRFHSLATRILLNEGDILSKVHSPATPQIYEYGLHEENTPYIIIQWLPASPMRAACLYPLLKSTKLTLVRELFSLLWDIHQQGIIHGDLKQDNILLQLSSLDPHSTLKPYFIDFGGIIGQEKLVSSPFMDRYKIALPKEDAHYLAAQDCGDLLFALYLSLLPPSNTMADEVTSLIDRYFDPYAENYIPLAKAFLSMLVTA